MNRLHILIVLVLAVQCTAAPDRTVRTGSPAEPDRRTAAQLPRQDRFAVAAAYSRQRSGDAVLVLVGDSLVFEEYQNGYLAGTPHMLASGSKSFSCAIAVRAIMDRLLTLDEAVANTITEFRGDTLKERITVRHLLDLSSGLTPGISGFEGGPIRATRRADALAGPILSPPGHTFRYGPTNFDVFGVLMARKLSGEKPHDYLQRAVLDPIGMHGLEWRTDREGMPMLPGGAFATASDWVRYGKLIRDDGFWNGERILDPELLGECAKPSAANLNYGLTFWLSSEAMADLVAERPLLRARLRELRRDSAVPVLMAAGAGNQRLYILKALDMVVVRLGRADPGWSDTEFLELIVQAAER